MVRVRATLVNALGLVRLRWTNLWFVAKGAPSAIGTVLLVLFLLIEASAIIDAHFISSGQFRVTSADLLILISSEGFLVGPTLVAVVLAVLVKINGGKHIASEILAYETRKRFVLSRLVDALCVSFAVTLIFAVVVLLVACSRAGTLINYQEETSLFVSITGIPSGVSFWQLLPMIFAGLWVCTAIMAVLYIALRWALNSVWLSFVVVLVFVLVVCATNLKDLFYFVPNYYAIIVNGWPTPGAIPWLIAAVGAALAFAGIEHVDFLGGE